MDLPLFQVYIGTQYQGPIHARNAEHAVKRYATLVNKSSFIFNAKPASTVQQLKESRK